MKTFLRFVHFIGRLLYHLACWGNAPLSQEQLKWMLSLGDTRGYKRGYKEALEQVPIAQVQPRRNGSLPRPRDERIVSLIRTKDLPAFPKKVDLRELIEMRKAEPCDPFLVARPSEDTVHNMEAVKKRHTRKLA